MGRACRARSSDVDLTPRIPTRARGHVVPHQRRDTWQHRITCAAPAPRFSLHRRGRPHMTQGRGIHQALTTRPRP